MQSISDTLLVTAHETWVEITLNRPDRLNSFNDDMHRALYAALTESRDTGMRAVLLTGAGRGFCAGQDLGDRDPSKMTEAPDLSKTLTTFYNPLVRLLKAMECPVICAVNGVAAGAGANIALACDIVIASEKAKFIQSFAKVGLVPDSGGTWTLRHLIGEARAKALALTAEPVTAKQAADWGMIWKALPEDEYLDHARALPRNLIRTNHRFGDDQSRDPGRRNKHFGRTIGPRSRQPENLWSDARLCRRRQRIFYKSAHPILRENGHEQIHRRTIRSRFDEKRPCLEMVRI